MKFKITVTEEFEIPTSNPDYTAQCLRDMLVHRSDDVGEIITQEVEDISDMAEHITTLISVQHEEERVEGRHAS